jgi:hypothetical protein
MGRPWGGGCIFHPSFGGVGSQAQAEKRAETSRGRELEKNERPFDLVITDLMMLIRTIRTAWA